MAPYDHFGELRDEMVLEMETAGLHVERAHHEVGTAGQAEINYKFDELLKAADDVMKFKYIVKNVAWRNGKTATFMPKPIFGDNGSGMHVPPVASGTTASRCSTTRPGTPASRTSRATTSAASSSTRRRCWRSPTRR